MEKGELKALQNWLSPDRIRANIIGRAFVNLKNIYTPVELLGPFHAASMVAKSMAVGVAQGVNRAFNVGFLQDSPLEAIKGLGEAIDGWRAPYKMYKEGRALMEAGGQTYGAWQKYEGGKQQFLATANGRRLQKLYPNLEQVIDAVLEGGSHIGVDPRYATRWRESMMDAFKAGQPIKALAHVPFVAVEGLTRPLFSHYIPALKLGAMAREISVELRRNAPQLATGDIGVPQVLQKAVRRIDNILGEFNWDNLNTSRSIKTLFQFVYRSFTWRLGTADLVKNAAQGQLELVKDAALRPIRMRKSGVNPEGQSVFEARRGVFPTIPQVSPDLLNIMAQLVAVGGTLATVFMLMYAKKRPASILDLTNPQTGELDSRGKPMRTNLPLYTSQDIPELVTNPFGIDGTPGWLKYATGGQSGLMNSAIEAIKNRDFQGTVLSERKGVASLPGRALHLLPKPFFMTGYKRMTQEGFPSKTAMGLQILG